MKVAGEGDTSFEEIARPTAREDLIADLQGLGEGPVASQGPFDVYLANAQAIPHLLLEIGRQRELAFRAVGEGSGKSRDLDRFDSYYLHLFLWHREEQRLAGGYRLGRTDLILAEFGFEGLYTSSICSMDRALIDHLNPGLELGRSWIATDFQRSLHSLLGLWKGIGRFVVRYPRYHRLFGAVSISSNYSPASQALMVRFFRATSQRKEWMGAIRPFVPFPEQLEDTGSLPRNLSEISSAVAHLEPDGRGIPVLLRQYFKLNATLLDFGYDPDFQNCLDATVLVDLHQAPSILLERYMGREGYRSFANGE